LGFINEEEENKEKEINKEENILLLIRLYFLG